MVIVLPEVMNVTPKWFIKFQRIQDLFSVYWYYTRGHRFVCFFNIFWHFKELVCFQNDRPINHLHTYLHTALTIYLKSQERRCPSSPSLISRKWPSFVHLHPIHDTCPSPQTSHMLKSLSWRCAHTHSLWFSSKLFSLSASLLIMQLHFFSLLVWYLLHHFPFIS